MAEIKSLDCRMIELVWEVEHSVKMPGIKSCLYHLWALLQGPYVLCASVPQSKMGYWCNSIYFIRLCWELKEIIQVHLQQVDLNWNLKRENHLIISLWLLPPLNFRGISAMFNFAFVPSFLLVFLFFLHLCNFYLNQEMCISPSVISSYWQRGRLVLWKNQMTGLYSLLFHLVVSFSFLTYTAKVKGFY